MYSLFSILLRFCATASLWFLTACAPIAMLNGVTPNDTYSRVDAIAYGEDVRQRLDIYQPNHVQKNSGSETPEKMPVVVFFYGGSWSSGQRSDYKFVGEALAARGIVTVIVDYRIYPQVRYPGFVEDSARAVAWTLQNIEQYGGDVKRVFVMGHSAGAYNAAMVALDARWLAPHHLTPGALRGWIGLAGPYNFLPIQPEAVKSIFVYPDTPFDTQPIAHVTRAAPPVFLGIAIDDSVVNSQINTTQLAAKLRAANVSVTERSYSGVSHSTLMGAFARPLRGLAPVLQDVTDFVLTQ